MKSEVKIRTVIKEIEANDQYKSGQRRPVTIVENAPLALIQLEMEAKISVLKWVLEDEEEN